VVRDVVMLHGEYKRRLLSKTALLAKAFFRRAAAASIVHSTHGLRRGLYSCAAPRLVRDVTLWNPTLSQRTRKDGAPVGQVIQRKCIGPFGKPRAGSLLGSVALRRFRFLRTTRSGVSGLTVVVLRTLADKSVRPTRFVMGKAGSSPLARIRNDKW
jgi:hypothetical protein